MHLTLQGILQEIAYNGELAPLNSSLWTRNASHQTKTLTLQHWVHERTSQCLDRKTATEDL